MAYDSSRHERAMKRLLLVRITNRAPDFERFAGTMGFLFVAARCSRRAKGDLRRLLRCGSLPLILAIASMPAPFADAHAQEGSRPLEFEVRPSGVEGESAEDRLDRRLKQREYLFRSICVQCSRGDRFTSGAPFKPLETLALPMPRERD